MKTLYLLVKIIVVVLIVYALIISTPDLSYMLEEVLDSIFN